uniref:Guanine nucleotide-binding protein subunit gamma n=1 Tax=Gopherus agassizii TaxID=38772 RepID=A0A452J6G4_9SAUR
MIKSFCLQICDGLYRVCIYFQVSKAAADLMAYCEAHAKEDPLLTPVPASENPFREKKFFCAIL